MRLKQAPRARFEKLKTTLNLWGFKDSNYDTSLFFRRINDVLAVVLIYIEDIVVIGNSSTQMEEII